MGSYAWGPNPIGLMTLQEEGRDTSVLSLCHVRTQKRQLLANQEESSHQKLNIDFGLPVSGSVRNKYLLFKCLVYVCGILLWHPKLANTASIVFTPHVTKITKKQGHLSPVQLPA